MIWLNRFNTIILIIKGHIKLLGCLLIISCQTNIKDDTSKSLKGEHTDILQTEYGIPITDTLIYDVDDVLNENFNFIKDSSITVRGRVKEICKIKGCWIDIVDLEDQNQTLFVQFPENSFTLPTSLENAELLVKGKIIKETISVEDQIYEAEKMGKTASEIASIVSPKEKISFLAEGVIIDKQRHQ